MTGRMRFGEDGKFDRYLAEPGGRRAASSGTERPVGAEIYRVNGYRTN